MKKVILITVILMFSFTLVAGDINKDVTVFGSIFSTAINASGKAKFRISPFIVEDCGIFYFVHTPMREIARKLMTERFFKERKKMMEMRVEREKLQLKRKEMRKKLQERILEGIKRAIIASAEYGSVLKNVPDKYWMVFVFQSPRQVGSVSLPGLVVRVKVRDVKKFADGKMSPEDFSSRIIIPNIPAKAAQLEMPAPAPSVR